ncbi:hypothetical protein EDM56_02665 [Brevibacillus fluminis]|uniref:Uncharacterized protein n=1 Tax=Brevibacillus fluminis TaxID=511487 RepID=A0A3M8DUA2_9BACL|nr:hypothetical protein EDM56_02665 [Brevibacillus fluminis]
MVEKKVQSITCIFFFFSRGHSRIDLKIRDVRRKILFLIHLGTHSSEHVPLLTRIGCTDKRMTCQAKTNAKRGMNEQ